MAHRGVRQFFATLLHGVFRFTAYLFVIIILMLSSIYTFVLLPSQAFQWAYNLHPLAGLVVSIIIIMIAIVLLWFALYNPGKRLFREPLMGILLNFAGVILVSLNGFSFLSYALYQYGITKYTSSQTITTQVLAYDYTWHLIDLLPSLEVWNTLQIDAPIKERNVWAGILLILFRLVIILPLFFLLTEWVVSVLKGKAMIRFVKETDDSEK
jgi:hypothetical protein